MTFKDWLRTSGRLFNTQTLKNRCGFISIQFEGDRPRYLNKISAINHLYLTTKRFWFIKTFYKFPIDHVGIVVVRNMKTIHIVSEQLRPTDTILRLL